MSERNNDRRIRQAVPVRQGLGDDELDLNQMLAGMCDEQEFCLGALRLETPNVCIIIDQSMDTTASGEDEAIAAIMDLAIAALRRGDVHWPGDNTSVAIITTHLGPIQATMDGEGTLIEMFEHICKQNWSWLHHGYSNFRGGRHRL